MKCVHRVLVRVHSVMITVLVSGQQPWKSDLDRTLSVDDKHSQGLHDKERARDHRTKEAMGTIRSLAYRYLVPTSTSVRWALPGRRLTMPSASSCFAGHSGRPRLRHARKP